MSTIYDYRPRNKRPRPTLGLPEDARGFDARLRWLMDVYGIGSRALADRVFLSWSAVDKYVLGLRRPSLDTAVLIADFFDVSLDWLAGRSDAMRPNLKGDTSDDHA